MRMVSDRLCKEYQLSVVRQPEQGKGKHYAEWQAEQDGKPSYHSMVKADVDEAIRKARTEKQFFFYLREKGYSFKFGKDITIRPKGRERGLKLKRNFGENYSLEESGFGFWKKMNYLPRRNFRFRDITGFGYPATSSRQEKSEDFGDCICITVIF